jgi:hypothetical protein
MRVVNVNMRRVLGLRFATPLSRRLMLLRLLASRIDYGVGGGAIE